MLVSLFFSVCRVLHGLKVERSHPPDVPPVILVDLVTSASGSARSLIILIKATSERWRSGLVSFWVFLVRTRLNPPHFDRFGSEEDAFSVFHQLGAFWGFAPAPLFCEFEGHLNRFLGPSTASAAHFATHFARTSSPSQAPPSVVRTGSSRGRPDPIWSGHSIMEGVCAQDPHLGPD
ncbi:hypothetical protein BKA93DRAFT_459515 [Sparassis latifolia]